MSEVLTTEEARLAALGAPRDPGANIKWGDGKVNKITRRTWTTKSPDVRLQRARLDLITAGCEDDARLLTTTRLNTAWQRLDKKMRGELMAERSQTAATEPPVKKKRLRKRGGGESRGLCPRCVPPSICCYISRVAAASNLTIARSLGVKSGSRTLIPMLEARRLARPWSRLLALPLTWR